MEVHMKNIKVIAREEIINPETMHLHDDTGLKKLGGYFEEIFQVNEPHDQDTTIQNFVERHPELKGWTLEIIEL